MVNGRNARGRALGVRGQLGEMLHHSGLLRPLRFARALWDQDLRILAYHRVLVDVDPDRFNFDLELVSASAAEFREQMRLIRRDYRPMRLGDVAAALAAGRRLPRNAIVVTFDDGYDDNFHVARPILRELGIPATFFVSTGLIDSGQPFAYDWLVYMVLNTEAPRLRVPEVGLDEAVPGTRAARRRLAAAVLDRLKNLDDGQQQRALERLEGESGLPRGSAPSGCRPMTWQQLREMCAEGFEVGSHGVSHRMLAKLPDAALRAELEGSLARLRSELGTQAALISYPVGGDRAFDQRVVETTREVGYELACSYICGTNRQPIGNPFALYRLPVESEMSTGWFASMLALPRIMSYPTARRADAAARGSACFS